MNNLSSRLLASAGLCMMLVPQIAAAEETSENSGLTDIVVTAQKREESLQRVPTSIAAFAGEQLETMGIQPSELVNYVPNMQNNAAWSDYLPIYSLRGISMIEYSAHNSSPIGFYTDEVYKANIALQSGQMFDIERVEVMRGPQGTVFGKNTPGGAVSVVTRTPDLGAVTGEVNGEYGTYDRVASWGNLNVPLAADKFGVRFAYNFARDDGFVKPQVAGQPRSTQTRNWAYRVSARWQPSDTVDLVLRYTNTRSDPYGYTYFGTGTTGTGGIGAPYHPTGFVSPDQDEDIHFSNDLRRVVYANQSLSLRGDVELSSDWSFTSVLSWDEGRIRNWEDPDASPFRIVEDYSRNDIEMYAGDFRIQNSGNGPLDILVGLYASRDKASNEQGIFYFLDFAGDNIGADADHNIIPGANGQNDCLDDFVTGCAVTNRLDQTRESWAVYANGKFRITDQFALLGGIRYTEDMHRIDNYDGYFSYLDPATQEFVLIGQLIDLVNGPRTKESNVSFKVGMEYQPAEDVLLYGTYSTGYRGTAFNGYAFFDPSEVDPAKSEKVRAWEIGAKSQWLDRRLRVNASAFYYTYLNQQYTHFDAATALQTLRNVPKSRIYGAELDVLAQVTDNLQVNLSGGLIDSRIEEFTFDGIDLAGNKLISTAPLNLTGAVDWTMVDNDRLSVDLHVDASYTGRQYYDIFNDKALSQPGYWLFNARLGAEFANGWTAGVYAKNIFDKRYIPFAFDMRGVANVIATMRSRPRTLGVQVGYKF